MPHLRTGRARILSAAAVLATGLALLTATPAQADENSAFIGELNSIGMRPRDPGAVAALGQSICPTLVKPGSSFVEAVAAARNGGVPPALAGFFAGLAIQHYCPQMISRATDGSFVDQIAMLRGMNIPGL